VSASTKSLAEQAFGAPGMPPTWSSSDKDFVMTALGPARLWATIGHGVVNEIFWPSTGPLDREAQLSAAILKAHEDRAYPGALVASLSIPWGNSMDTLGGYHLVWPRDATLAAFALLAANQTADATRILAGFISTQQSDGHWAQNC
jgi:GH15 family glucan-1,4-alpha-glucosidase